MYAAYFAVLLLAGLMVVLRAPGGVRIGEVLGAGLLVVIAVGSALVRWRASLAANLSEVATAPLLGGLDALLEALGIVLLTSGPLAGGALLMLVHREGRDGRVILALLYLVALWYVVRWAPWIADSAIASTGGGSSC